MVLASKGERLEGSWSIARNLSLVYNINI